LTARSSASPHLPAGDILREQAYHSGGAIVRASGVPPAAPHLLGFLLPVVVVLSARAGTSWLWVPILALYGALPLVDALAPPNPVTLDNDDVAALDRTLAFRVITWAWVPVHVALIIWALDYVHSTPLEAWQFVSFVVAVGSTAGAVGMTFAHELIHRSGRLERGLGDVLLALMTYRHFAIEHVHGHHRHVGTPEDPATAKLGEGYFQFLIRTVTGGLAHAWSVEVDRLGRRGRPVLHRSNLMLRYALTTGVVYAMVSVVWGGAGTLFFGLQSLVAIALLEGINYVEHYGLVRRRIASGRFEPIAAWHSWDSSHRVSNWLLINLARHADHHLTASRRYPALATREQAPQLPAGYGSMLLLAMVPPLWRRVMDPRVTAAQRAHDVTPVT
jgi:alkane 1-monooxygenase